MLSTLERVLFLRSADIFNAVSGEDLVPVATVAYEASFDAGETFIREGERGDCLYVIVAGQVRVMVHGVDQLAVRGSGSVMGEMALLSDHPRSATCLAVTDVLALGLHREDFLELLAERPSLALGVIKVLTQRLEEATQALARAGQRASPAVDPPAQQAPAGRSP